MTRFLSQLADSGYSPNTLCGYAYDLRHLVSFLDDRDLTFDGFRPSSALEFLVYLRQAPSRRPAQRFGLGVAAGNGRLLSAATVQRVLAAMSSFFEWAIAAEAYAGADNPMQQRVDRGLGRVPERHSPFVGAANRQRPVRRTVRVRLPIRLPRPLDSDEVQALLESMTTLRDLAIFLLMLGGGLRPGEVLCLQLEDVSYGRRRVTIRKRDDHPRGARAKARREREVDLHEPRTLDAVNRYMLHERPVDAASPFVFLVGGSGPRRCESLSYQAVARGFVRRLDRLGIRSPEKTPHARRHTHATAMWEGGMHELALQKRLGHASPESIRIYTRVCDEQIEDLDELRQAIDAFTARLRLDPVREFYARPRGDRPTVEPAGTYFNTAIARLHSAHVLLFHIGQVDQPPSKRIDAGTWTDRLVPTGASPQICAVVERYLRLHLGAHPDRPQTVRHFRDALGRLVVWLARAHPNITKLDQLHREHAEQFLCGLSQQTSQHTGAPLTVSTRRSVVTLLTRFVNETAAWGWEDVPGRVLFTRGDIPKIAKTLPRYIPEHELATLMTAVEELPDPYQRAALIVARWSGARRDEIRRLVSDCLDTYPDGHSRLRIPVGKGYTERSIPLHPQAAAALQPLIELARQHAARPRFDPSAGRPVQYLFQVRGKLLSNAFLFEHGLKAVCARSQPRRCRGKTDDQRAPVPPHHWHPTRRGRRPPANDHGRAGAPHSTHVADLCLSDPTVKQQYQHALDRHLGPDVTMAGPAAQALREHRLHPDAVHWLQTNFLKPNSNSATVSACPPKGPASVTSC